MDLNIVLLIALHHLAVSNHLVQPYLYPILLLLITNILSHLLITVKQIIYIEHNKVEQKRCINFLRHFPILGTRYRTVLFRKLADAFLMMYQTAAVGIFTNIGAFGGFRHEKPVSIERVHSGDFGIEKARKRRNVGV